MAVGPVPSTPLPPTPLPSTQLPLGKRARLCITLARWLRGFPGQAVMAHILRLKDGSINWKAADQADEGCQTDISFVCSDNQTGRQSKQQRRRSKWKRPTFDKQMQTPASWLQTRTDGDQTLTILSQNDGRI